MASIVDSRTRRIEQLVLRRRFAGRPSVRLDATGRDGYLRFGVTASESVT